MDSPVKIVWAMPQYGPIYVPVYSSHLEAIAYASRYFEVNHLARFVAAGATDRMYTHSAENAVVKEFLNLEGTHLFLTESDMLLPLETVPKLLALDKDIASGVYFLRNGNGQPCLYKKGHIDPKRPYGHFPVNLFPTNGPFRIDCPGVGCALIKREVFEGVQEPWFDLAEGKYGSDMYFYTKVRDAGFEVWAHPGVMCDQIDYVVVGYKDYEKRLREDPTYGSKGWIIGEEGDQGPRRVRRDGG